MRSAAPTWRHICGSIGSPVERFMLMAPSEGPQTSVYCASAPNLERGRYDRRCAPSPASEEALDVEATERVWAAGSWGGWAVRALGADSPDLRGCHLALRGSCRTRVSERKRPLTGSLKHSAYRERGDGSGISTARVLQFTELRRRSRRLARRSSRYRIRCRSYTTKDRSPARLRPSR